MRKETTPVNLNSVQPSPAKTPEKAAPRHADTIPPIVGIGASTGATAALPAKIIGLQSDIARLSHPDQGQPPEQMLDGESPHTLEKIVATLHHRTGNDFSLYKKNTLYRRIARRIGVHQISSMSGYERYLRKNPQEVDLLFKEMLIGVTSFFRDPAVWDRLKEDAIAALLAAYPDGKVLRAWVPACSTGEEAYSLAIVFKEALEQAKPETSFSLQIFATDLDHDAIDRARQGIFPGHIVDDVSPERLRRFFIADGSSYRVSDDIRKMVVFAPQNIAMDPPFTKLDILTCRNLFIYLEPEMQSRLIPLFHHALNRGGLLLLGGAESIGSYRGLFSVLDSKARLYRRIEGPTMRAVKLPARPPSTEMPISAKSGEGAAPLNLQLQADRFLLQNYSPAAVVVNRDGDILYINGRTEKYLEPAAGKTNWNVYAMAREGLRHELAGALTKAIQQLGTVTISGLPVIQSQGEIQTVDLTVRAIDKPDALEGMVMIIFTDVAAPAPEAAVSRNRAGADRAELLRTPEELQAIRNEIQFSNAKLVATNEELQAINEELTTSREAMQSLNEELQTANAELMSRIENQSSVKNDMKNLLNRADMATIFLDGALQVRRFTEKTRQIFRLTPADVGRLLSDIVSDLQYPELQEDIRIVLKTLKYSEKQVPTRDGRWFKVCIMPCPTFENVIHGLVLTFADISAFKALEAELSIGQMPAPPKSPIDGS